MAESLLLLTDGTELLLVGGVDGGLLLAESFATTWGVTFEVAFDTDPGTEPGPGDWTDVSDRLMSTVNVSLGTGRLSGSAQGNATVVLDNLDRAIDPTNPSATYNLVPMRHARMFAIVGDVVRPLFRGLVDAWPPHWSSFTSWVSVRLVDAFTWLALQDSDLDLPKQMSHERIDALLDLAGWPAELRDISDGVIELEAHEQASANLYRSLLDAADAEDGDLYISPDGKITFRNRHARFDRTETMTFGEGGIPFEPVDPAWDTAWLTNIARVELEDGRIYEVVDDASVDAYGPRVMPTRDLPLREAEAVAIGQWEVYRFSQPRLWIDALTVHEAEQGALEAVMPLRVGHLVTVSHDPPAGGSIEQLMSVERVTHTIGGREWAVTVDLAPDFGAGPWFTWDEPALGWDLDALWAP